MHLDDRQCTGCVSGADETVGSPENRGLRQLPALANAVVHVLPIYGTACGAWELPYSSGELPMAPHRPHEHTIVTHKEGGSLFKQTDALAIHFAAGQLPTFLPGPGARNTRRSARFNFFILTSTLGLLDPCCAARHSAMARVLPSPERRMPTAHAPASHTSSQRSVQRRRVDSRSRPLPDSALRGATFGNLGVKRAGPLVKIGRADVPSTCLD